MNGFEEFESTSGLIMMFRRVFFLLAFIPSFFASLIPQTFSFQPGVMPPGVAFCSWGVLDRLVGIDRRRREGLAAGQCCMKQLPPRSTKKSNGTVCDDEYNELNGRLLVDC